MDLDELRAEAEEGLDANLFTPHPDGYTCRCGDPVDCICSSTFPELTVAEIGLSYREMRNKRDELVTLSMEFERALTAVRELAESIPKEGIERQDKYHWNGCERLHVPCFANKILEMINDG